MSKGPAPQPEKATTLGFRSLDVVIENIGGASMGYPAGWTKVLLESHLAGRIIKGTKVVMSEEKLRKKGSSKDLLNE
jgi:hypothetical protein